MPLRSATMQNMRLGNLLPFSADRKDVASIAYICLGCFVLGIAAIAWPVLKNNGFPLDDSWIHQVVGRNAAQFGIPGFSAGASSSGSSSAVWPWIIALNYKFAPFIDPVYFLFVLNAIFLLIICGTLFKLADGDKLPPLEVGILAALPLLTGNVVWLAATGMEHLLFVAASYAACYFWLLPHNVRRSWHAFAAGIFCGLAIASRMEAVAFIPVFLFSAWPLRKSRGDIALFIAPCALATALVLLDNLWTSGTLIPLTFSGRKWLYFGSTPDSPPMLAAKMLLDACIHMVRYSFGITAGTFQNFVALSAVLVIVVIAGLLRLVKLKAWRILFLIALAATDVGAYCIMLPTYGHGMRYLAMTLFFVLPLFALGGLELIERIAARLNMTPGMFRSGRMAIAGIAALFGLSSLLIWSEITDLGIKHVNGTNVRMGKWLAANLPPTIPVASFDIGAIGYFGGRQIIDLGGLTAPEFTPYLISGQSASYLRERNIQWMVIPMGFPDPDSGLHVSCEWFMDSLSLCNPPEMEKREVKSFSTSEDAWKIGFLATSHSAPSQVLYHITWD
jgi:hypothetical protein